jgi:hypothetical protein
MAGAAGRCSGQGDTCVFGVGTSLLEAVPSVASGLASSRCTAWKTNWCTARASRKADFRLLRVHIDIDARRIDFEEQAVGRVAAAVQQVLVSLAQRMAQ